MQSIVIFMLQLETCNTFAFSFLYHFFVLSLICKEAPNSYLKVPTYFLFFPYEFEFSLHSVVGKANNFKTESKNETKLVN